MEINTGVLTALVIGALILVLFTSLPVIFCLIGVALVFTLIVWSPNALGILVNSVYGVIYNDNYLAIPLFVIMAAILEFSGVAEDLFDAAYKWAGGFSGSLAVATIGACAVLAAMTGLAATGIVVMGLIAYPEMIKRNYNKKIALGSIMLGGALGPIIPPSTLMIIVAAFAELSVGKLFMAGLFPGIIIALISVGYVVFRCATNPSLAPVVPREERAGWHEKFLSIRKLIMPIVIIFLVLGGIYSGAATPTEAAALGAAGAFVAALINRRASLKGLKAGGDTVLKTCGMIYWLLIGGATYSSFMSSSGVGPYIKDLLLSTHLGATALVLLMLFIIFILGTVVETVAIIMITVPIFFPIIMALGVDPIWFATLYVIDLVVGCLTPPFGYNLFYMKGVVGEKASMSEIYSSSWAFTGTALVSLVFVFIFPQLAVWLPAQMIR